MPRIQIDSPDTVSILIGEPADLTQYHLFQGDRTNDCGPTSAAMTLNWFAGQPARFSIQQVSSDPACTQLEITGGRVGKFVQKSIGTPMMKTSIEGATPPWTYQFVFNNLAKKSQLPVRCLRKRATTADIYDRINQGLPVPVLFCWPNGGAHWETIVGYRIGAETAFISLDPGKKSPDLRLIPLPEFLQNWQRGLVAHGLIHHLTSQIIIACFRK